MMSFFFYREGRTEKYVTEDLNFKPVVFLIDEDETLVQFERHGFHMPTRLTSIYVQVDTEWDFKLEFRIRKALEAEYDLPKEKPAREWTPGDYLPRLA
jgi:hypothetical protein